jgi:YVTN family beta-propeller protein
MRGRGRSEVVVLLIAGLLALGALPALGAHGTGAVPAQARTESPALPPSSTLSKVPPRGVASSPASPRISPDLYSIAGVVTDSSLINYNATIPGNFDTAAAGWQLGTPAFLPELGLLWYPTISVPVDHYPAAPAGPTLEYDPTSGQFVGIVPGLTNASALVYDPQNGLVYAVLPSSNVVEVFDPSVDQILGAPIAVGTDPVALALSLTSEKLFVANEGSNNVSVIDTETNKINSANVAVGLAPMALALDSNNRTLFVADSGDDRLWTVNTTTLSSAISATLSGHLGGVAYSSAANSVAIIVPSKPNAVILNASTYGTIVTSPVGVGAVQVTVSLNQSEFLVADDTAGSVTPVNASNGCAVCTPIITGGTASVLASASRGSLLYVWNSLEREIVTVNLTLATTIGASPSLDSSPVSIAYDPEWDRLFVANDVGNYVSVLNSSTFLTATAPISLPSSPTLIAFSPLENRLYVGLTTGLESFNATTLLPVKSVTGLPGSTAPVLVDQPARLLWAVNSVSGLISFTLTTLAPGPAVTMPITLAGPESAVYGPGEKNFFVVNGANGTVVEVNATTGAVVEPALDAGSGAVSVAYDSTDDSIYVLGSNVTILNATTGTLDTTEISLGPHETPTSIVFDPSRNALYAVTSNVSSSETGAISVIDGDTVASGLGSLTTIAVGQAPGAAQVLFYAGSSAEGSGVIVVANNVSGSLSVISSPLAVTQFVATPAHIDLGQSFETSLEYVGGAGPPTIVYDGLPMGCASVNSSVLTCTPTESGTFELEARLTARLNGSATELASVSVASQFSAVETVVGAVQSDFDVGTTVAMVGSATGGTPGYDYAWNFGDGVTASGPSTTHAYSAPGTYAIALTVSDSLGATTSNVTLITVHSIPSIQVAVSPNTTTDVGVPVTLNASVSGGSPEAAANWTLGAGMPVAGFVITYNWTSPGNYTATFEYRDAAGTSIARSILITVDPQLTAEAAWSVTGASTTTAPTTAESIAFVATISGGTSPYVVSWNFGDGSFGSGLSVSHEYARAGNYTVNVTVEDARGSVEQFPLSIHVDAASPPTNSPSSNDLSQGILLGVVVGAALGAAAVYLVAGSRRRGPPPAPSPYVPPSRSGVQAWKED